MEPITFNSQGSRLTGTVYTPQNASVRRPAIVVTGSWLTVKEQMPSNYAPLLAEQGLLAMTFDFRGFGESEGEPREVESAKSKAEDLRNAIAYLRTRDTSPAMREVSAITLITEPSGKWAR